jgi:tetratricopeptide (TPR) repeat protein
LQLEPGLTRAQLGLADALYERVLAFHGGNEAVDLPRADALLSSALAVDPNNAWAHFTKAKMLVWWKHQFNDGLSEFDVAIENDRNLAWAYATRGVTHMYLGRSDEVIPGDDAALRPSPRDPRRNLWELHICYAHAYMAEWEKAVEWCQKSIATDAGYWAPYMYLAAAYGWLGDEAGAKVAIGGLHKIMPGHTVLDFVKIKWSDNPQYLRERARVLEGLRKAGLPEE